jgi:hypothetical protein
MGIGPAGAQPKTPPTPPKTPPATTTPPKAPPAARVNVATPAVMAILKDLEAAGVKFPTLVADMEHTLVDVALDDREHRTGWVAYQARDAKAGTPAKFHIQFQKLQLGRGKLTTDVVDYAFDGQWLSILKHRIKTLTQYQVAAKGEQVEPTRLGQGPLPLPFGQKTQDMLRRFQMTTRALKKGEPADSRYLKLQPLPAFRKSLNFKTLEMWVNTAGLPTRIVSTNKDGNTTTVVFRNIRTGQKFGTVMFSPGRPLGWTHTVKPLKRGENLGPGG